MSFTLRFLQGDSFPLFLPGNHKSVKERGYHRWGFETIVVKCAGLGGKTVRGTAPPNFGFWQKQCTVNMFCTPFSSGSVSFSSQTLQRCWWSKWKLKSKVSKNKPCEMLTLLNGERNHCLAGGKEGTDQGKEGRDSLPSICSFIVQIDLIYSSVKHFFCSVDTRETMRGMTSTRDKFSLVFSGTAEEHSQARVAACEP